jgi:hypothetical protein
MHNIVHTGIGDRTCPIPYLCRILLTCEVELAIQKEATRVVLEYDS